MKQKKLILVKLIGIGNNESKRINNKDEDDSIKKDYKYNEDKCNNNDNDDDDYDENINNDDDSGKYDDDWKIEYINVIVRLVSINPGSLNWTWTPPSSSRRK